MRPQDSSKHLQGVTDLTLLADIEPGFIDALDSVTYETRLRVVMKTLNALRLSSREHAPIKPFSDAVERIQMIHSFRVAVVDGDKGSKFLLAVTFDGGWEPYIRRIWRDLGPLLDVMLCNCAGYKSSWQNGFDDYVGWIREKQVDTGFFYNASPTTVTDLQYLRQLEKKVRESGAADAGVAQMVAYDPEQVAIATASAKDNQDEARRLGVLALSALYKLTDYYPPERDEGAYLKRASHELLKEINTANLFPAGCEERRAFEKMFKWFDEPVKERAPNPERLQYRREEVQGGIVDSYDGRDGLITHGALLLMQVAQGESKGRDFLEQLRASVSTQAGEVPADRIYLNVAFTAQGLEKLGVPEATRNLFPKEFREGMEVRAGLLGDLRANHPRNWALPKRNWPPGPPADVEIGRVQLSLVDIVLQLRISAPEKLAHYEIVGDPDHPLSDKVADLARRAGGHGVRLLAVEPMISIRNEQGRPIGHMGFLDDASQPKAVIPVPGKPASKPTGVHWQDEVPLGEVLRGYIGSRDDPSAENAYLDNGSFLVIRKLKLDLDAIDALAGRLPAGIDHEGLLAKMMGRKRDGEALADPNNLGNDFNYDGDAAGKLCPFQAHVRRANPRAPKGRLAPPRIMRRGMSYGPPREKGEAAGAERGLMFMAYNASIAEQFEMIQRWIAGANSSGVFSGEGDPLLAVPEKGDQRVFRFQHRDNDGRDEKVLRVELDDPKAAEPMPFARLEWGAYLFAPSLPALELMAKEAQPTEPDEVAVGDAVIRKLLGLETVDPVKAAAGWKAAIEDLGSKERGVNVAVWAAIRKKYGGALWTPYGVLVASRAMVDYVFRDPHDIYSVEGHAGAAGQVEGYKHRSADSIGEIYLGLDRGETYDKQSTATNKAIFALEEKPAFELARGITRSVLTGILDAVAGASGKREAPIDLKFLSDRVLGALSSHWFDLPDEHHAYVEPGGWDGTRDPERKARCPGDFTSPSRYIFSPRPSAVVKEYAVAQGDLLRRAALEFVREMRANPGELKGPLSEAMFNDIKDIEDEKRLASTLIGVMMGFLPTADGCFRSVLHVWLTDRSLWRVQANLAYADGDDYQRAKEALEDPLKQTLQKRPVPDIVWRIAKVKHDLGPVAVQPGERIVIGIVSATQEALAGNEIDVYPVFGGKRSAGEATDGDPTHACPAYKAAMGVLLGMISALLDAGTLRPHPMPLVVVLSEEEEE